jgi:hypothetical protein
MSGAIDIAIDGHIFALTAGGQVLDLLRGEVAKAMTVDVSPAIQSPAALINPAGSDYLYLAETGGRILKLTKEGALVRQYRLSGDSAELANLSDLWVDEETRTLYAVAGNRVISVVLEQPLGQHKALDI